jgi:hypothetical protein
MDMGYGRMVMRRKSIQGSIEWIRKMEWGCINGLVNSAIMEIFGRIFERGMVDCI